MGWGKVVVMVWLEVKERMRQRKAEERRVRGERERSGSSDRTERLEEGQDQQQRVPPSTELLRSTHSVFQELMIGITTGKSFKS